MGKLKEFQQKMEAMENEVSMLKNKVTLAGSTARELADRPRPKETTEENKAKPESHPRSGNYTEQDVSIEKFFYTGHK